jgi:very-short-patch-repair endonuclease
MNAYISRERRKLEKELLLYLRKYRFYASRFKRLQDLDSIINEIVCELKRDI